jgi:hypothetical protein
MAHRISVAERREALPAAIGRVQTDLAECIAEASSVGLLAPDEMYGVLADLDRWANDVRTGRVRAIHLVGGVDLEDWLKELREDDGEDSAIGAIATPVPVPLSEQPWVPNPSPWEYLRPSVARWRLAAASRWWRAYLRGDVR